MEPENIDGTTDHDEVSSSAPDLLILRRLSMLGVTIKQCLCLRAWLLSNRQDQLRALLKKSVISKMLGGEEEELEC